MTTSSTPDRGRALLMSTAAASFVLSAALVVGPAHASNECGAPSNGTVTCTSAGNPYGTGITYTTTTTDLTVVTDNTVSATAPVSVTGASANVTANNAGTINSTTANAGGITAYSMSGAATIINSGTVTTNAASAPGLNASSASGNVTVTSTGSVTTKGATSDGVDAVSGGSGATNVTVGNVTVSGTQSAAVFAESVAGTATVTVNQGATVSATNTTVPSNANPNGANDAGVVLAASPSGTGAPTMTLNNNGAIAVQPGTGSFAVVTVPNSGAAVINNNSGGTITGPMLLEGGLPGAGNTVNNAGTWNVTDTSVFGASQTNNVLNNTGTIAVAPGVKNAGTTYFNGLTTLNNVGGVVDTSTGNSLNIENAEFEGGQNSTLRVNANSQSGLLTLASTQGGSTNVVLADIPATNPAMNLSGETLVTGPQNSTLGPAAGSFTLGGPGSMDQNAGFVDYRLLYNGANQQANTPSNYVLYGLPGTAVFEALNMPAALQNFWRSSANAVTQRQMSLRDSVIGDKPSRAEGWEFWAVPYGGEDYFKRPEFFHFGGINGGANFVFPGVGNHNDTVGLQIGADMIGHWNWGSSPGSSLGAGYGYWGFTAGVEQQTTHFPGDDANNLYSVGGNVGVYGGANWNGFYVNALGKIDFDDMNTNFQTAGFSPTSIYKAYGARGEVGYRWPWMGFYVEPSARINAFWNDDIILHPPGAFLGATDDGPLVEAQFGGRVGTTFNFGKFLPNQVNPFPGQFNIYFGAWYADQYDGNNLLRFTTFGGFEGTESIDLAQAQTGSYIHTEYGLETADWYGGLKLFLKGENDFSGDSVGGWNALAGVRFSF